MFNAAYTIRTDSPTILKTLQTMLEEKGYKLDHPKKKDPVKDKLGTIHLKAVNKSILSVLKYQLKRSRDIDPEAQRAAITFSLVPTDEGYSHVFLSIYPIMEFYHLPEIPGITESQEERMTDEMLCEGILNELTEAMDELFPDAEEHFITRPMRRSYLLPDSRTSFSRDDVKQTIIEILKLQRFEVIKTKESEFNLSLEIIGINRSLFHIIKDMLKSRTLSRFLKDTQRVTARFIILKPTLGWNHKIQIIVEMFPSMEFFGMEEIHTLTQDMDEEIADSRLGKDLWEPLVKLLDEEYGKYLQE